MMGLMQNECAVTVKNERSFVNQMIFAAGILLL